MLAAQLNRETLGHALLAYGSTPTVKTEFSSCIWSAKHRSVRKLLANLPPEVGQMSTAPFYSWLKADEERELIEP